MMIRTGKSTAPRHQSQLADRKCAAMHQDPQRQPQRNPNQFGKTGAAFHSGAVRL